MKKLNFWQETNSIKLFWKHGLLLGIFPLLLPLILLRDWFAALFFFMMVPVYLWFFSILYGISTALIVRNFIKKPQISTGSLAIISLTISSGLIYLNYLTLLNIL